MSEELAFRQQYLAEWCETQDECALRFLAREYHERTEAFDQTHCRARDERGIAVPQGEERTACTAFALRQHRQLGAHAAYLGFDSRAWNEAVSSEARHFDADWASGRYRDDPRFQRIPYLSSSSSAT